MSRLLTPKRVALLAVPAVLIAVGIAIGAWNAGAVFSIPVDVAAVSNA